MDTSKLQALCEHEKNQINYLCEKWQKIVDTSTRKTLSEERKGAILAVLGQSRLLISKKLKHFDQLLNDTEGSLGDMPPIALSDLEGLWEVVMIQVKDIYAKFNDLEASSSSETESTRKSKPASTNRPFRTTKPFTKNRRD